MYFVVYCSSNSFQLGVEQHKYVMKRIGKTKVMWNKWENIKSFNLI